MDTQQIIGKKIKEARQKLGLTQEELGKRVGYSAMGISHFECGIRKAKLEDLERIARALDLNVSFFLDTSVLPSLSGPTPTTGVNYFRSSFDVFDENKRREISQATTKFEEFVKNLHDSKKTE